MRDIVGTIASRYLIAVLNLVLIFINAKVLGVEGVGLIGIILASVNIAMMFNGILAGNTIVYFMNRYSLQAVFRPSYLWTLVGSGLAVLCRLSVCCRRGILRMFIVCPYWFRWLQPIRVSCWGKTGYSLSI